jgi:hypothetical protein
VNATRELWRPVVGYEETHEVSNQGRVRTKDRIVTRSDGLEKRFKARVLRPSRASYGPPVKYARVILTYEGRRRDVRVHVLVLEAFVGPRPPGLVACHGPNGISDNSIDNLRWDTYSANSYDIVRHGKSHRANQTHCKHGHAFTPENTKKDSSGRHCKTCWRISAARQRQRKKKRQV